MLGISQLLLIQFWPNFKGWFLGPSITDANCHGTICSGHICPSDICLYRHNLSCYWPNFDQTFGTHQKFLDPRFFFAQKFFRPKFFLTQNLFSDLKSLLNPTSFGDQHFLGPKYFGFIFFTQYCFWTQNFFSDTNEIFWILNFLLNPNFLGQIFLDTKFFNTKSFFFDPNFYFKYYISVFGGGWGVLTNMLKLLTLWRGLGGSKPKWWHADTFKAREGWESWNIEQVLL